MVYVGGQALFFLRDGKDIAASIFKDLPKTSYYKLIDAWLLYCLLMLMAIFALHTYVGNIIHRSRERSKIAMVRPSEGDGQGDEDALKKGDLCPHAKAKRVNRMAQIILCLAMVGFNVGFWGIAVWAYLREFD